MKKFRWILLSGLLVASTHIAQAQAPGASPAAPGFAPSGGPGFAGGSEAGAGGFAGGEAGGISNVPGASTTTTTTTTGIAPDGGATFVPADDAASSSSIPNTGGEPLIAVLAGLSIAGAAVAMRRKVTA